MEFKDLTPEQQEKVKACKTPEEIISFAKEMGYELSEEEIAAVSGGMEVSESCLCACSELVLCKRQF